MNSKQYQVALQINRAMQMATQNLNLSDEMAMQVADLYPKWSNPIAYAVGDIVGYGVNANNETQLYKVQQAHTSKQTDTPDKVPALYKAIGFTEDGTSIWTQPLGAHDAYEKGDVVSHKDKLWVSNQDGNIWEPGVYGWTEKTPGKATTK